jgi:RND family efflux transporter MFP subunit
MPLIDLTRTLDSTDLERLQERVRDLEVRADVAGIVQEVAVEVGQRVSDGTEVARIVNPEILIARVRVSERDAALVELDQPVRLEMGRETMEGKVMRIDPAVRERLVEVDVELTSEPTRQLRPDLTVTARVVIDRVAETLVVDRPAGLRDDAEAVELFRLDRDGKRASRVSVGIGRISARAVEIVSGLEAGDRIILADMTESIEEPVIRIR